MGAVTGLPPAGRPARPGRARPFGSGPGARVRAQARLEPGSASGGERGEPEADAAQHGDDQPVSLTEWTLLTGFPGPISAAPRRPCATRQVARPEAGELGRQFYGQDVQPVFRSSPFESEADRRGAGRTHARILLLDEGNCCRSVIAEAMLTRLLKKLAASGKSLDCTVESASLGPAFAAHDPRVARLAAEAGLPLPPRTGRCFDEVRDMVAYDLVLVMDRFDHDEVMREVAVLDTINPGGFYSARVRQLGRFAAAAAGFRLDKAPWALGEGISDPLYASEGGEAGNAALWATLRKLRLAAAGLAQYLAQLQARSVAGTSLQAALAQALLCPLLEPGSSLAAWPVPEKGADWRPVWQGSGSEEGVGAADASQLYSIRRRGDRSFIVRRPHPYYKVDRGYWSDLGNLQREIEGWMDVHAAGRARLPSSRELRATGANAICNAIEAHGGYYAVASALGLRPTKTANSLRWADLELLRAELRDFVAAGCADAPAGAEQPAMPSKHELLRRGRADLAAAIAKLGGFARAAEQCGFAISHSRLQLAARSQQAQGGRSASLGHTREVLWRCCPQAMGEGRLPSRTELVDQGHRKLARAITNLGGFKAVADMLGLRHTRAARNSSKEWQDTQHELSPASS